MVPHDGRGNEGFIRDPVGQRVDLSAQGWPITPVKEGAAARTRMPLARTALVRDELLHEGR